MKKSKAFWGYIVLALVIYAVVQVLINSGVLNIYYQNMLITMCINIMLAVSLHIIAPPFCLTTEKAGISLGPSAM